MPNRIDPRDLNVGDTVYAVEALVASVWVRRVTIRDKAALARCACDYYATAEEAGRALSYYLDHGGAT
jgi:hypothetical protein